jgi:hypothetical protein
MAPAPSPNAAQTESNDEHVVVQDPAHIVRCRRTPAVGSLLGRRVCSSRAQDQRNAQQAGDQLSVMQERQTGNPTYNIP